MLSNKHIRIADSRGASFSPLGGLHLYGNKYFRREYIFI